MQNSATGFTIEGVMRAGRNRPGAALSLVTTNQGMAFGFALS
jgi:hypothetical protein